MYSLKAANDGINLYVDVNISICIIYYYIYHAELMFGSGRMNKYGRFSRN